MTGNLGLTALMMSFVCCRSMTEIRRAVGDSPLFGMHYSLITRGKVHKGDTVWVRGSGASIDQGLTGNRGWGWW